MALLSLSREGAPLPPDAFDVRGWEARTELDDEPVGRIEDLLLGTDGTPRHVVVELRGVGSGQVVVPLAYARADAGRNIVWVRGLTAPMPRYAGKPAEITPEAEARVVEEYRRGGPAAPVGTTPEGRRLVRFSDVKEYRVAKESVDPRGWTLVGGDGQKIGEVVDLLVDRAEMNARYLDCDVDEKRLELERVDRHILVPVERVRLDGDDKRVVVAGLFGRDVQRYPVYGGLPIPPEGERSLAAWYEGAGDVDPEWAARSARRFFGSAARPRRAGAPQAVEASRPATGAPGRGRATVHLSDDADVRIRVEGDDIVIERGPAGEDDHGRD